MECEIAKILVIEYADGSLAEDRRQALKTHLASCEKCRTEFSRVKSLFSAAKKIAVPEFPEVFWKMQYDNLLETWNRKRAFFLAARILKAGFAFLFIAAVAWTSFRFLTPVQRQSPAVAVMNNNGGSAVQAVFASDTVLPAEEMVYFVNYVDPGTQKIIVADLLK